MTNVSVCSLHAQLVSKYCLLAVVSVMIIIFYYCICSFFYTLSIWISRHVIHIVSFVLFIQSFGVHIFANILSFLYLST